jgi:hypothetical protein
MGQGGLGHEERLAKIGGRQIFQGIYGFCGLEHFFAVLAIETLP